MESYYTTIYAYCPHCGDIAREIITHTRTKERFFCNACGNASEQKEEYIILDDKRDVEQLKEELKQKVAEYEDELCKKDFVSKILNPSKYDDLPANNAFSERIKGDISELKNYILHLINLEVSALFWEYYAVNINRIQIEKTRNLYVAKKTHNHKTNQSENRRAFLKEIEKLRSDFKKTNWEEIVTPVRIPFPVKPSYLPEITPVIPTEPVMKKPGLFNKKKVLAYNEMATAQYERALEQYRIQCEELQKAKETNTLLQAEYDQQIQSYKQQVAAAKEEAKEKGLLEKEKALKELNEKIKTITAKMSKLNTPWNPYEKQITDVFVCELSASARQTTKIFEARNKLYSMNVIYTNYRDLFALSSIYEYLNSGRCYELEGPHGAYNLYEQERRSDWFSSTIRTLENIDKRQSVLYRELDTMFEIVKGATSPAEKILSALREPSMYTKARVEQLLDAYCDSREQQEDRINQIIENSLAFISA